MRDTIFGMSEIYVGGTGIAEILAVGMYPGEDGFAVCEDNRTMLAADGAMIAARRNAIDGSIALITGALGASSDAVKLRASLNDRNIDVSEVGDRPANCPKNWVIEARQGASRTIVARLPLLKTADVLHLAALRSGPFAVAYMDTYIVDDWKRLSARLAMVTEGTLLINHGDVSALRFESGLGDSSAETVHIYSFNGDAPPPERANVEGTILVTRGSNNVWFYCDGKFEELLVDPLADPASTTGAGAYFAGELIAGIAAAGGRSGSLRGLAIEAVAATRRGLVSGLRPVEWELALWDGK